MKPERHGLRRTRLYRIWANIKTRCFNKNDPHYERWGGRGITMCPDWKDSFMNFYEWAMEHGYQNDLEIDRIDNDHGYWPENCRWITHAEQARNKRTSILLTYNGKTQTAAEWRRELGIGKNTITIRYHKGWSVEECLFGKKKGVVV